MPKFRESGQTTPAPFKWLQVLILYRISEKQAGENLIKAAKNTPEISSAEAVYKNQAGRLLYRPNKRNFHD